MLSQDGDDDNGSGSASIPPGPWPSGRLAPGFCPRSVHGETMKAERMCRVRRPGP